MDKDTKIKMFELVFEAFKRMEENNSNYLVSSMYDDLYDAQIKVLQAEGYYEEYETWLFNGDF